MALEYSHALPSSDVPEPTGLINGGSAANVSTEFELRAGNLASVPS